MKSIKIFALATAALIVGLTSCSKENNNEVPDGGSRAVLKINFEQAKIQNSTRAFDDNGTVVAKINDAMVFILGPLNEVIGNPIYTTTIETPAEHLTTTNATTVVVVSNLGVEANYAELKVATSLSALQACMSEMTATFSTANLWLSGTGAVGAFVPDSVDPTKLVAKPTVSLEIIPARIDITVNNIMENYGEVGALVLNDVSVLYSAGFNYLVKSTSYTPAEADVVAPYYRSGLATWISQVPAEHSYVSFLSSAWDATNAPLEVFTKSFYALPGVKNAIITIRGTLNGNSVYFPVHFNGSQADKLVNGKLYKVVVNLKGKALQGGGGTTDPEITITDAYVEVIITPPTWIPVDVPAIDFQ